MDLKYQDAPDIRQKQMQSSAFCGFANYLVYWLQTPPLLAVRNELTVHRSFGTDLRSIPILITPSRVAFQVMSLPHDG